MNGNKYVLIVAGGIGSRLNSEIPKQFLELNRKPVLMHSIQAFFNALPGITIILVLPSQYLDHWRELCKIHNFNIQHQLTSGGETRFHSVQSGLNLINSNDGIVGVHDAVRPLVSSETIISCYNSAEEYGSGIPVVSIKDSIRRVDKNKNSKAENRKNFLLIQTPQCFPVGKLKEAYSIEYHEQFTDDASVMESAGHTISLVPGNSENIKITFQEDFIYAEALMKRSY